MEFTTSESGGRYSLHTRPSYAGEGDDGSGLGRGASESTYAFQTMHERALFIELQKSQGREYELRRSLDYVRELLNRVQTKSGRISRKRVIAAIEHVNRIGR
jgi:hypothetical protein